MTNTVRAVLGLWLAVTLIACGTTQAQETSAERQETITATATVESVNLETREVGLRTEAGELVTVVAGPEVRILPQLAAGDKVRFDYRKSVAVDMAEPTDPGQPLGAVVTQRAAEGEKPAGAVAVATSIVVELVSYDPATAVAVVKLHDGSTQSIDVNPAMRAFAEARKPGDRIIVTITEAIAVSIVEPAG
jgi:hypothetical protein